MIKTNNVLKKLPLFFIFFVFTFPLNFDSEDCRSDITPLIGAKRGASPTPKDPAIFVLLYQKERVY
jgi:hypothetical protein